MTEITKPYSRRCANIFGHYKKRIVVELLPHDRIAMRLERNRVRYVADIDEVFKLLARWHAAKVQAQKQQERDARRGKVRVKLVRRG